MDGHKYTPFTTYLLKFGDLNKEELDYFDKLLIKIELPKKSILLKKGKVSDHLYFIEKGLARNYYEREEKELTNDLTIEGQMLIALTSFLSKEPSLETIELLEDSVLYALHNDDLQALYKTYPTFERIGRLIAEANYVYTKKQAYLLRYCNSKERYEYVMAHKKEIILRAPIGHIASYLGMTIETLSRIRGKLE